MTKRLHIAEINRALARHDPDAVYTLLREAFPQGQAGRVLYELIKTQHDWPKPKNLDDLNYHQILTPMELKVLRHMEEGLSTEEIAHEIPMSYHTVRSHKQHIYMKFDVHSPAGAIHVGHLLGLFPE